MYTSRTNSAPDAFRCGFSIDRSFSTLHSPSHILHFTAQFPHVEQVEWKLEEAPSTTVKLKLKLDQPVMDCGVAAASIPGEAGHELSFDVDKSKFLALYEELSQAQSLLHS